MTGQPDPLAKFRRQGAKPTVPLTQPKSGFGAFGIAASAAKTSRIEMRHTSGVTVARLYNGLTEIVHDLPQWEGVLLVWSNKMAKIKGRNLRPVIEALLARTCEYVAELAAVELFKNDGPVIDRLVLLTPPVNPQVSLSMPEQYQQLNSSKPEICRV